MRHEQRIKKGYEKFNYGSGDKFGRLTLTGVSYIKTTPNHRGRIVEAVCQCGTVKSYWFHLLKNGETQSCGCLHKEVVRKLMTTHNLSNHLLYDVWQKMNLRCSDPKDKGYKNYGGRGIEVWKDWKDEFIEFYEWAIANGYEQGLSLDRIDNDGNYAPYNCKFSTRPEQNRNRRNNRMYTAFGETKCLFDWGKDKRCKVTIWGLRSRMDQHGWTDFEKALTTPVDRKKISRHHKNNRNLTAWGETKCFTAWLEDKRCLVKIDSLRDRLAKGWSAEKSMGTPPARDGKNSK